MLNENLCRHCRVVHADRQLEVKTVGAGFTVALSGYRGAYN